MSTFWKVFITVIITAAVIGGGGYYLMHKKSVDDKVKLQSQIDDLNKQISDLKKTSTDETVSWKTYTNEIYGFSLKYPSGWSIENKLLAPDKESGPNDALTVSKTSDNQLIMNINPAGFGIHAIPEVQYSAIIKDKKIAITNREYLGVENHTEEISTQPGYIGFVLPRDSNGNNLGLVNNGNEYYPRANSKNLTEENTIVKILSTFQFTK